MDIQDYVGEFISLYDEDPKSARDILRILVSVLGKKGPAFRDVRPILKEDAAELLWLILRASRTREDIADFVYNVYDVVSEFEHSTRRIREPRW